MNRFTRIELGVIALFLLPGVTLGQQSGPVSAGTPGIVQSLRVKPGDVINISVFDTPELSGPTRVEISGDIEVPLLGVVRVQDLTLSEIASELQNRFKAGGFLKNPQISVTLADFVFHSINVLGEVSKPGTVPVAGQLRLWDVISASGGTTPAASSHVLISHEDSDKGAQSYEVHWGAPLGTQPNPKLVAGDTVQILPAGFLYIVGEVNKPGSIPIVHEHMMLSQLLTIGGGLTSTAKGGRAILVNVESSPNSPKQVDLYAILEGRRPDIALKDGDMLYVPNSISKVVIQRGLQAAVAAATSIVVYTQAR